MVHISYISFLFRGFKIWNQFLNITRGWGGEIGRKGFVCKETINGEKVKKIMWNDFAKFLIKISLEDAVDGVSKKVCSCHLGTLSTYISVQLKKSVTVICKSKQKTWLSSQPYTPRVAAKILAHQSY